MNPRTLVALAAYITSVVAANALTARYGMVDVGVGLAVTAGTFAAALTLVVRDHVQDAGGRWLVLAAIGAGAVLSAWVAPAALAVASGAAFLVSEVADMAAYTPLRRRGRRALAWIASNIVGGLVDTALFLWLAGFPLAGFAGQFTVKTVIGVAVPCLLLAGEGVRRAVLRHRLHRAGA